MKRKHAGFSLIELLIVVAIILIIAAIAIPDLLKSRQAANQASAVGSLRTINTSEVTYSSTYTLGFSSLLADLDGSASPSTSASAGLIDSILAGMIKSNYNFIYTACPTTPAAIACTVGGTQTEPGQVCTAGTTISTYEVSASPLQCAGNGNFYFTDHSGVIRMNTAAPAGPTDSPLAG